MEIIKNINKLIIKKIIEIVFVACFLFVSIFLWKNNITQATIAAFQNSSYVNFNIENPIDYSMFPMTDKDALKNLNPCYITVSNETYTMEDYSLVFVVNKSSTLDYHFLHISVNDNVYSLNDLETLENEEEISFILVTDSIVGNLETYAIRLWLNTMAGNEMQNKELIMHFDLLKGNIKI